MSATLAPNVETFDGLGTDGAAFQTFALFASPGFLKECLAAYTAAYLESSAFLVAITDVWNATLFDDTVSNRVELESVQKL